MLIRSSRFFSKNLTVTELRLPVEVLQHRITIPSIHSDCIWHFLPRPALFTPATPLNRVVVEIANNSSNCSSGKCFLQKSCINHAALFLLDHVSASFLRQTVDGCIAVVWIKPRPHGRIQYGKISARAGQIR